MPGMNSVHLTGRVGADPDFRRFTGGGEVIEFNVATSETWRDRNSGDKKEKTQWHRVKITNENLVKIARDFVKKGDLVGIEGQLEYRSWEKDGQKHTIAEVVVSFGGKLHLLGSASGGNSGGGSRRDDGRGGGGGGDRRDDGRRSSSGQQQSRAPSTYQQDMDDDIPF